MLNHMNNARFLRLMDFGRFDHMMRSRLFHAVTGKGKGALVAASTIRYRKPLWIFLPYKLSTQVILFSFTSL